ncbi:MAG: formate--tetrahydrofolate ligase, partial [Candidatus Methanomethylicia archaeon]
ERLGNIIVALSKDGKIVKAKDIKCDGCMAAIMRDSLKPNLVQTMEGTPAFIHGIPFANIAHGTPSVISIKMALKLADYAIVEAGFGADLGFEKFCNIACRAGGFKPDLGIVVVSIRALREHGGAKDHTKPNIEALKRGIENLEKQVENVLKFGVPAVVAINKFEGDTEEEIEYIRNWCEERRIPVALSEVYERGGDGGIELAKTIIETLNNRESKFKFLYDINMPIEEKIKIIAREMYGADDVIFTDDAKTSMRRINRWGYSNLPINMAKTPLSLTDDPKIIGRPRGFKITITDLKVFGGAGFIVAYCGEISTLPALPTEPAAENIDLDPETGEIIGVR